MCGPKAVIHASDNLWGPDIDTVKRWKRKHAIHFDFGKALQNIKLVSEIYKQFKQNNKETRPVPYLLAEDKTAIEQRSEYDAQTDLVFGYCGVKKDNHKCEEYYVIEVCV